VLPAVITTQTDRRTFGKGYRRQNGTEAKDKIACYICKHRKTFEKHVLVCLELTLIPSLITARIDM
jgi:Holliday junction resolvase RusA-like endonuclease